MSLSIKSFVAGATFLGILFAMSSLSAVGAGVQTPVGGAGANVGNGIGVDANVLGIGANVGVGRGYYGPGSSRYYPRDYYYGNVYRGYYDGYYDYDRPGYYDYDTSYPYYYDNYYPQDQYYYDGRSSRDGAYFYRR